MNTKIFQRIICLFLMFLFLTSTISPIENTCSNAIKTRNKVKHINDNNTDESTIKAETDLVILKLNETKRIKIYVDTTKSIHTLIRHPSMRKYITNKDKLIKRNAVDFSFVKKEDGKLLKDSDGIYLDVTGRYIGETENEIFINNNKLDIRICVIGNDEVYEHTPDEIKQYIKNNTYYFPWKLEYEEKPNLTAPYSPGKLSEKTINNLLNVINVKRYIAGVDEVVFDKDYGEITQMRALNFELKHLGIDRSKEIENLNLQIKDRYNDLVTDTEYYSDGHPDDFDENVLNPDSTEIGFGWVQNSFAYTLHTFGKAATQSYVFWPAKNTPVEVFDVGGWDVYLPCNPTDNDPIKVELSRLNDNKKWVFDSSNDENTKDFVYFFCSEGSMFSGQGRIQFYPKIDTYPEYQSGDRFNIKITGLITGNIEYNVEFFSLNEADPNIKVPDHNAPSINLSNGKTYSNSKKVIIEDENIIKKIKLNGKRIFNRKKQAHYAFRLGTIKKYLNKGINTITITDILNNTRKVSFRVKS